MRVKRLVALSGAIALICIASACGETKEEPSFVSIIAINSSNQPHIEAQKIFEEGIKNGDTPVGKVLRYGGRIAFNGEVVGDTKGQEDTSANTEGAREDVYTSDFEDGVTEVASAFDKDYISYPEIILNSLEDEKDEESKWTKKTILVYGNGLNVGSADSQPPDLNFSGDGLRDITKAEYQSQISKLIQNRELNGKTLAGSSVDWQGLGTLVAGEQEEIYGAGAHGYTWKKLENIYEYLFKRLGATKITLSEDYPGGIVDVNKVNDGKAYSVVNSQPEAIHCSLEFISNTTDFVSESEADQQIDSLVESIKNNYKNGRFSLVGSVDDDVISDLSRERVVKIKGILNKKGIDDFTCFYGARVAKLMHDINPDSPIAGLEKSDQRGCFVFVDGDQDFEKLKPSLRAL